MYINQIESKLFLWGRLHKTKHKTAVANTTNTTTE